MLYAAALLELWYLSKHVEGTLNIPTMMAYQHETVPLHAVVRNTGILPLPEVLVRLAVRVIPDTEESLLTGKIMLDQREEGTLVFDLESSHAGAMEVRLERIAVQDHLGMFIRKCTISEEAAKKVFYFPRLDERNVNGNDTEATPGGSEGPEIRARQGGDDLIDVRNYREGDLIKFIHWKLSARMNDLMVRDMGELGEPFLRLYLNLFEADRKTDRRDRAKWDRFFQTVEELTLLLLGRGQPFQVIWINEKRQMVEDYQVHDGDDRQNMMCALLLTDSFVRQTEMGFMKELPSYEAESEIIEINLQGDLIRRQGGRG